MHCCCKSGEPGSPAPSGVNTPRGRGFGGVVRRLAAAVKWSAPVVTLALVPKCPFCVVGYITLLTGVSVSLSTAAAVRWVMLALSIGALTYLVGRVAWRVLVGRIA